MIQYAEIHADHFTAFAEPAWAKTVYALGVTTLDDNHTLLRAVMRTATTDKQARRWFRRYWTLGVGSGAHTLVHGLLAVVREDAGSGERAGCGIRVRIGRVSAPSARLRR